MYLFWCGVKEGNTRVVGMDEKMIQVVVSTVDHLGSELERGELILSLGDCGLVRKRCGRGSEEGED